MAKKGKEEIFAISLGGSVAVPDEINTSYLKRFYNAIKKETEKGRKFIIIIGGGKISRRYQEALSKASKASNEDKDWIGIKVTELNSLLLKAVFREIANPVIFDKRFKIKKFGKRPVLIGCGWKPGWSTDFIAVQIAVDFNISKIINLGKPDYVYTADFETDPRAEKIENISWKDYLKIIPGKWKPGLSAPLDPVAAKLAMKSKMEAIVASGNDLDNFKKILNGKKFRGTLIS
ncbi:MAG: UMP kinase [bacterium]|nr:UMP kinase [bacterium]